MTDHKSAKFLAQGYVGGHLEETVAEAYLDLRELVENYFVAKTDYKNGVGSFDNMVNRENELKAVLENNALSNI